MPVPGSIKGVFGSSRPPASGDDWISKALKDLKNSSPTKQLVVGGGSGFCAGYVASKFGKAAAAALGGTLLIVHLGTQYGYIKVDWSRLQKDMQKAKKEVEDKAEENIPRLVDRLRRIVAENIVLASSFSGGFLLGLAAS